MSSHPHYNIVLDTGMVLDLLVDTDSWDATKPPHTELMDAMTDKEIAGYDRNSARHHEVAMERFLEKNISGKCVVFLCSADWGWHVQLSKELDEAAVAKLYDVERATEWSWV